MVLGLNDFDAGKSITQAVGREGSWKYRLFCAHMALLFQGPKKFWFAGHPLLMALVMDVAQIKIIMSHAIKTTGTLKVIPHSPLPARESKGCFRKY
jgi:hypothetical protein